MHEVLDFPFWPPTKGQENRTDIMCQVQHLQRSEPRQPVEVPDQAILCQDVLETKIF